MLFLTIRTITVGKIGNDTTNYIFWCLMKNLAHFCKLFKLLLRNEYLYFFEFFFHWLTLI